MNEKEATKIFINGQEIKEINESEIKFENDLIVRDCEINTTYGCIKFQAQFTVEQWNGFIEIQKTMQQALDKMLEDNKND